MIKTNGLKCYCYGAGYDPRLWEVVFYAGTLWYSLYIGANEVNKNNVDEFNDMSNQYTVPHGVGIFVNKNGHIVEG